MWLVSLLCTSPGFDSAKVVWYNCTCTCACLALSHSGSCTCIYMYILCIFYRDGEDLDELLERQADMIRYLQQHNANLGRRILELQAGAME